MLIYLYIINLYLFFMKKIFTTLFIFILSLNNVFALVDWKKNLEQASDNTNKLLQFFSLDMLINIIFAIIAIIMTLIISKIVDSKIWKFVEKSWSWENREELAWVMTRTANITILSIWFTIVLSILWIDMWIFLWGLWFWIWFTLKIFLSNFIAWIIMVTQWSYHNWDLIKMWDKIWNIKKINSLFTEVQQFDWVIFFIPNVKFLENEVENFHTNDKRRIEISLWLEHSTDIVKAKKIMKQVVDNFPNVLKTPETSIIISNINENNITLSLRLWINSRWDYISTKSNVTETIKLAFHQYGIKIALPQLELTNKKI